MHRSPYSWLLSSLVVVACGDSTGVTSTADTEATGTSGSSSGSASVPTESDSPATVPDTDTGGSVSDSMTMATTGTASTPTTTTVSTTDATDDTTATTATTATTGDTSSGGVVGECATDADCDDALGPAPCGAWLCNQQNLACEAQSPGCSDADQDGFGAGANCMCAGLDCDDTDEDVQDSAVFACYSGDPMTAGVGTCKPGALSCVAGVLGPCIGEVTPSGEACNDLDDDCDTEVDEDLGDFACGLGACATTVSACSNGVVGQCVAPAGANSDGPMCNGVDDDCDGPVDENCNQCIPVRQGGNDQTADGTLQNPFQTIQAAINWAATHNGPNNVCVAAGTQCGATGTYANANNQTVTMADGVSVLGNYESTNWTRCTNSTTVIQPKTAAGVTFPDTVQSPTVLDGFRIDRFQATTTAAITVDGATGALLSNLTINNTPNVTNSYGVNIINGGDAKITRSRIDAGFGSAESIAARVVASRVTVENNCLSLDNQGRCDDFCANNPSLRGRTQQGTGVSYSVLLDDSPNSIIQTSALCAHDADQGAGIRIAGDGAGIVIRGNLINNFGGLQDSHGIWMEDCDGAAPWIVDQHFIAAGGDNQMSRVDGVRAIGDCHPVIDSNVEISGGGEGAASNPNGVHCAANGQNVASRCIVVGNLEIRGSEAGYPPIATGVRCDDGSCLRVEDNVITGRGGVISTGLFLQRTGSYVSGNQIRGGCSQTATGVHAEDASARVENNTVQGYTASDCTGNPPPAQTSVGMRVLVAQGIHELEVHSNTIDATGSNNNCTGRALELSIVGMAPAGGRGVFRNNILRAGACATRFDLVEMMTAADPRVFENNNLDSAGNPTALYRDENTTDLTMAAQVDALADMIVAATLSVDSLLVNPPTDLHLQNGSPCIDAGTNAGAPLTDIDGAPRDQNPDIGADER